MNQKDSALSEMHGVFKVVQFNSVIEIYCILTLVVTVTKVSKF